MKIKKLISAFCLAAGLALSVPAFTALPGGSGISSAVQAADGWQQDEQGWYYLQDDERLTGLQKIQDATYFFDDDGYRVTGSVRIDDARLYFNPGSGKLCTGYAGLVQIGKGSDVYYYFSSAKNGSLVTKKWVKYNGKYFYADAEGQVKLGTIKVGKKLYHITPKGRMTSYGQSSYDKKYYYAGSNGVLLTGLRKIGGKQYYFNPKTGERQTGVVKVGKSVFYFSEKDGTAATGWVKIDGKYYYYKSNYRRATGWNTIDGKKYYFDAKNAGVRVSGKWQKIDKKYYYFNSAGVLQTGFFKVKGKTYYGGTDGARQYGWKVIGDKKYFFNKKNGVMKTGWFYSNGAYFYLNPSTSSSSYGAAKKGWAKISGDWYYFDETRGSRVTGWLTIDSSKKYYFDKKTGIMYTGKHTIDGQVYDFGTNGALTVTGPWSIKVQRGNSTNGYQCFVVVYRGGTPIKSFVCSTAKDGVSTPTGTFSIKDKLYWHELQGPTWGQYCSHITNDILFHSVPNLSYRDPYSLETWEYNKLGSPASAGCIRLSVRHAKWLFDNVPIGTPVTVSDHVPAPSGVTIERPPRQDGSKSYDPTDTFVNPYSVR